MIWYEILQNFLMLYGCCHLAFKIFQWTKYYIGGSILRPKRVIGDQRSLINPTLIIPENRLIISIVCSNSSKVGEHAFLFFEWRESNKRWFARADFGPSQEKFSEIMRGKPSITVESCSEEIVITEEMPTLDKALQLLGDENIEFQSFPYLFAEENIHEKIAALEAMMKRHTYSLFGDSSSTSANSRTNNQNCATWCVKVLKDEFQIDLKLDKEFWMAIRTPQLIVKHAAKGRHNQ